MHAACLALAPSRLASIAMHARTPSSYADDGWRTFQGVRVPSWISFRSSGQYFWQGVCIQHSIQVSRTRCDECSPA